MEPEYKRLDDEPQEKPAGPININGVFYPRLTGWQRVGRFFTRRFAWLGVSLFSFGASVPLLSKSVANFAIGLFRNTIGALWYGSFDKEYFVSAGKSFLAVFGFIGLGLGSLFGILKPSIPGYFIKQQILQSPRDMRERAVNQDVKKSLTAENTLKQNKDVAVEAGNILKKSGGILSSAPKRIFRDVKAGDEVIDSVDVLIPNKNVPYQIVFLPNAEAYQTGYGNYVCPPLTGDRYRYHTRIFNYPGVTIYQGKAVLDETNGLFDTIQKKWRQEFPESVVELIAAGVAQIYQLKAQNGWSWEQVVANLNLYGHSLGGGVAAQVRAHFIEYHQVYLKTFIDRSFSSLKAVGVSYANKYAHLPAWFSGPISQMALHGAGGWELDTLESLKKYGDKNVNYINVFLRPQEKYPSPWEQVKKFFGLGEDPVSADNIIFDDATLARGIEDTHTAASTHAQVMRLTLGTDKHKFYFQPDSDDANLNAHSAPLSCLSYIGTSGLSVDGAACYARWVHSSGKAKPPRGEEVCTFDQPPLDRRQSNAIVRPAAPSQ